MSKKNVLKNIFSLFILQDEFFICTRIQEDILCDVYEIKPAG
jgi:hypothetical protein